jgi:protein-arginine kinase
MQDRADRFVEAIVEQERNARVRLATEMPRVYGDAICRALATLKNCRLLSPGELFDLLSPLRLAAMDGLLENATLDGIEKLMAGQNLDSKEDGLEPDERDRLDAERADDMNAGFSETVLNDKAEGMFL